MSDKTLNERNITVSTPNILSFAYMFSLNSLNSVTKIVSVHTLLHRHQDTDNRQDLLN